MAQQRINVPNIGDASDVEVVEILVKQGARVEREQPLIVLESEKASMDIPSPAAGVVREISLHVGDKVSAGSAILVLDVEEDEAGPPASKADAKAAEPAPKAASKAAEPAPKTGAKAAQPAPKAASKAAEPAPPKAAAKPRESSPPEAAAPERSGSAPPPPGDPVEAATDEELSVPTPPPGEQSAGPRRTIPPGRPVAQSEPPKAPRKLPYAGPAVRHMARELGVDLTHVDGSAPRGRIIKDDVQRYVKHAMSVAAAPSAAGFAVAEAPDIDFAQFGEISEQPLTKIQRVAGKNLHRSWVTIPHVTQFDEADITELEEFRKKIRGEHADVKLTLVTFFMKALVSALKAMPRFNSSLDKGGEKLIIKHYFHIGVAVDTPNGLMVPVIRDVDLKSLGQLAKELEEVSARARARKLGPSDLQGASITVSSLGGIGGTAFTPIINPPEVAVLGVSRARWRPVYQGGAFVPRLLCPLSLSYDHRVIDGADAARFTTRLGEILGDIRQMLL
jgi:pyruvate dehydrogenase E2 component (dihydrolipoamide acetyltransferase)